MKLGPYNHTIFVSDAFPFMVFCLILLNEERVLYFLLFSVPLEMPVVFPIANF